MRAGPGTLEALEPNRAALRELRQDRLAIGDEVGLLVAGGHGRGHLVRQRARRCGHRRQVNVVRIPPGDGALWDLVD
eukprot:scaffold16778_cov129-Isochrysis_galbana.AAC.1